MTYDDIPKSEWDTYRPKRSMNGHDSIEPGRTIIERKPDGTWKQKGSRRWEK